MKLLKSLPITERIRYYNDITILADSMRTVNSSIQLIKELLNQRYHELVSSQTANPPKTSFEALDAIDEKENNFAHFVAELIVDQREEKEYREIYPHQYSDVDLAKALNKNFVSVLEWVKENRPQFFAQRNEWKNLPFQTIIEDASFSYVQWMVKHTMDFPRKLSFPLTMGLLALEYIGFSKLAQRISEKHTRPRKVKGFNLNPPANPVGFEPITP